MTNSFQPLSGLGQVADQYEAVFCDIWGVIHNGRDAYYEACGCDDYEYSNAEHRRAG